MSLDSEPDRFGKPVEAVISEFLGALRAPSHLLVAISGGSDSTGLLVALHDALSRLPPTSGIRLSAATIDHALRPESAAEAVEVGKLCAALGVSHVTRRWSAPKPATGISAAARDARYTLLSQIADDLGATAIVTGHTLNDQIETVTMRASRGRHHDDDAQALGLSGMAPATLLDARHWILRPLLSLRRNEIRDYLTSRGHGWIDDPSNLDPHYERVRVRQALSLGENPVDFTQAGQARAGLAEAAADWLSRYATVDRSVVATIAADGFAQDPAIVRHALSTLAAVLGGRPHVLSRQSADRLMTFLATGENGRMTAGRVVFDRRRKALYLLREDRGLPECRLQPGEAGFWDGRFQVVNRSAEPISVMAAERDGKNFKTLPPGVARVASRVSPQIAGADPAEVVVTPCLCPFDRFLPVFDLPLASRIAVLFGRGGYLLPPV